MSELQKLCRTLDAVCPDAEDHSAQLRQRAQHLAQSATLASAVGTGSRRVEGAQTARSLQLASKSVQQAAHLLHRVAVEGRGFVSRHAGFPANQGVANVLSALYGEQRDGSEKEIGEAISASSGPGVEPRKLPVTSQSYHLRNVNGRFLQVFDHPIRSASTAVVNQGSALPNSFRGTCGPCAVGTICRKAGIPADELGVTIFAAGNGLCTKGSKKLGENGGTSAKDLSLILEGYGGISSTSSIGASIHELAQYVEEGRGVIIGINPHLLPDAGYGPQTPGENAGHWIVFHSVARDPATNEIVGFYLLDSNGTSIADTCLFYSPTTVEAAFLSDGSYSVVTDDIVW